MEQTEPATYHETDGTIVEPRMITGDGPVGRPWAKGRGEFTWRDMKRTVNTVEYRQYLAEHGGGEEE